MKYIGHTMATPGMNTPAAIKLFSEIGLNGIELVARDNNDFNLNISEKKLEEVKTASNLYNLPVVTITPYMWEINNPDDKMRERQIMGLKRAVDLARYLGAHNIRAYGGSDSFGFGEKSVKQTVDSLKRAGEYALDNGINIIVENHPKTLTPSGELTAKMLGLVGMENVKALFDPANAQYDAGEDSLVTFETQKNIISYVHCKDYYIEGGVRHACVVGEGIIPWKEIMQKLVSVGYDGCISFEYEKMWYPDDLEDARTGLTKCVNFIKKALNE